MSFDYDEYAEDIRALLDKHIAGVSVKEPDGAYLVGNMGKNAKPEEMSDTEARNKTDIITGRVTKIIEQELADDPYAQAYFSALLKQAIEEAKSLFDAPIKQYLLFADFEQQLKDRHVEGLPTQLLNGLADNTKRRVQAYYGLFLQQGFQSLGEQNLFDYAVQIDTVVNNTVAEYSINPQEIENQIRQQLLPVLYGDLGVEKANALIDEVIKITRLGLSGY